MSLLKGRLASVLVALVALLPAWWPVCASGSARAGEPGDQPGILVSRQLLEARELSVGDVIHLAAEMEHGTERPFRIVGVYEPTPDPMKINRERHEARLHLPDLLALRANPDDPQAAEAVTAINIRLEDPADAPGFARDLVTRLPGLVAVPTVMPPDAPGPFAVLKRFHLAISLVTVFGSTAFLLALMVMRADERRETVGILRLLGLSKGRILLEVLVEGLLIALAGAVFGVLFAAATQGFVNRFFQWRYDTTLVFLRVTVGIAWRCVALAVPLGVLAGLVASWTLLRRDIVALLRR